MEHIKFVMRISQISCNIFLQHTFPVNMTSQHTFRKFFLVFFSIQNWTD
jgi:hypothetical protein